VRLFRISLAIAGVLLLALAVIIMQARSAAADNSLTAASTTIGLFLAFGLASVAFWAYFRFRRVPGPRPGQPEPLETTAIETPTLQR
jgi:uncharacterized membrane protein YidH (DUF202 family)